MESDIEKKGLVKQPKTKKWKVAKVKKVKKVAARCGAAIANAAEEHLKETRRSASGNELGEKVKHVEKVKKVKR